MSFASDIGRMIAHGPQRPMNEQETMTLLHLTMLCEEPEAAQIDFYKMMATSSLTMGILDQRFRSCIGTDVSFSPPLLVWLSTLAAGNPGHAVLMVAVVAYMISEGRELTLNSLINHYFANGIPSGINVQLAWDAQKANEDRLKSVGLEKAGWGGNMLDLKEAWL